MSFMLGLSRTQRSAILKPGLRSYVAPADIKVIDWLLKVEKDGHNYYRGLAAKAPNKEFEYIFTMLANEEKKHYDAIQQMRFSEDVQAKLEESAIVATTLNIFEKLKVDPDVDLLAAKHQVALFEEARDLEARNRAEYLQRAREATDPEVKKLFVQIALEEQKHYTALDELVKFVSGFEEGWHSPNKDQVDQKAPVEQAAKFEAENVH